MPRVLTDAEWEWLYNNGEPLTDLGKLAAENDRLRSMLQRIYDAEFDYGLWPTKDEIRAALDGKD